ncbi:MAG: iron complex transport system substrate-binding protein [Sediminicola sp.]|jgi:iron complex transport system substrate-binding protein
MLVNDQLNRTLTFQKTPERIISLVPSQTELLVDLGLKSKLVGITKFCVHPKELRKEVTVVGGTKTLHYDKIKALKPGIIICNKEENTVEIVEQCGKIAPVWVSDIYTLEDSLEMILSLGEIFKIYGKTSEICEKIVSEAYKFSVSIQSKPKRKVAYLIWKKPYMAAGRNTFVNAMLELNNFENILLEENSRYPEIELSTLKSADLVLLSSEPFPFKESDVIELKKALQTEVLLVDGDYFSWYGSRLQNAFAYFKTLHP